MSSESELREIKRILTQIRDQSTAAAAAPTPVAPATGNVDQYTRELRLARQELDLLEKGSGAYNRKLREVEKLTNNARAAMKGHRQEMDALGSTFNAVSAAGQALIGTMDFMMDTIGRLVKNVFDEAKKLDTLTVQFRASTGASEQLAANIGILTDRLRLYGITSEKSAQIAQTMHASFSAFTQLNQAQQAEVGRTAAILGELGVSYQVTAQIFEDSTRTLGMSLGEAESLIIDLRDTAMNLQVPIEQLTRDFASAQNMVVSLGHAGPKAFKELAATSKATGVEMNTLLGITDQFDTYEGAANAVQKLNSVLRGNFLDAISMVEETDPAKRFEMMRNAIFDAGYSVEQLSDKRFYHLKKSMADAIGVDVPNFMKMLSGNVEELTEQVDVVSKSFEDLSKEAFGLKDFDSVMNNMMAMLERPVQRIQKATRDSFSAFEPLISRFESFNEDLINKTNKFIDKNSEMVGAVGLLYNLANIDGVKKGYEIFKGMAGFTGSMLSNLFSVKGLLLTGIAFAAYQIRGDFAKIGQAFQKDGVLGGLSAIFDALKTKFIEFQDYLDKEFGINKNFVVKGLGYIKQLALTGFRYLQLHFLGPMYDYIELDLLPKIPPLFMSVASKIGTYFQNMFIDVLNDLTHKFLNWFVGGAGSVILKAMGINTSQLFGAGSTADPEHGMSKENIKFFREIKRKERFMKSQVALADAATEFGNTRGAQELTKRSNAAITAAAPHVAKAADMVNDAVDWTSKKTNEVLKSGLEILAEGVARQKQEHYITVHIDESLEGRIGRGVDSKLNKMGKAALLNGAGF